MSGARRRITTAVALLTLTLCTLLSAGPASAVPDPGPGRALWGGTFHLQDREPDLGRRVEVVRLYSRWETGPPVIDKAALRARVDGGARTIMWSSTINWGAWRDEARRLNSDGNPANDVPTPYCKHRPLTPGTATPSGKTWFGAVADGDYDRQVRRWLEDLASVAGDQPFYVTFQHEAERLSDGAHSVYQRCVGTPAEYRRAWTRIRTLAAGPGDQPDLLRRSGQGPLVLTMIYTNWGFWHTPNAPGTATRALANARTGEPIPTQDVNDQNLYNSRATLWRPAAVDYDVVATDVYNFSGSVGPNPTEVAVDDPATAVAETDLWLPLSVLLKPFVRWADNWADLPDGTRRPLVLAEYGSVPDPTRPNRRAAWLGAACRYLSAPAQARFHAAVYFDVAQWSLSTWRWQKSDGRWTAVGAPTGRDLPSIRAMGALGGSARFAGTGACPP